MEVVYLIIICVLLIAVAVMSCILIKNRDHNLKALRKSNVTIVINDNPITMRLSNREKRVISDVIAQYTYTYDENTIFLKNEK